MYKEKRPEGTGAKGKETKPERKQRKGEGGETGAGLKEDWGGNRVRCQREGGTLPALRSDPEAGGERRKPRGPACIVGAVLGLPGCRGEREQPQQGEGPLSFAPTCVD